MLLRELLSNQMGDRMPALQNPDPANMGIFDPSALEMMAQNRLDASKPQTSAQKEAAGRAGEKEARLREKEDRLQGKKASAPPPPPPPATHTPQVDKSALLDKLNAYRKRFPHLQKRNNVTVKSSPEEIVDEIHFCEVQLGSSDSGNNFASIVFLSAVNAVEAIHREHWNPLNLRLDGLTNVVRDNMDQIVPLLDELSIKYAHGMYMGPEMRLVLTVGAMAATVHSANNGNPAVASALNRAAGVVAPPKGSEGL